MFALLTNKVRADRRPPFLAPPVNAAIIARLFPGLAKPSSSAPKKSGPAQSLLIESKNGKKPFPVQIPLEVLNAPDRVDPGTHAQKNGKQQHNPVNGQVKPFIRSADRAAQNQPPTGANHPDEQHRVDLETPVLRPSYPISMDEPAGQRQTPEPDKQPKPALDAGVSEPAPKPVPSALPSRPDPHRPARSALTLNRIIQQHPDIPDQSILLGVCEDGLPVVLDLFDPAPGALLAVGDERDSQLDLLRNAIDSAASRNSPRAFQFLVISHQPQTWQTWMEGRGFRRHCLAVVGAEDESVREWVLRLADWTEQRRLGQISGPPVLLVLDTLSFLPRLGYDVRLNFDWMAKEGPPAQVWPLAAISTDLAVSLGIRMLRGFQSRILGFTKNSQVYSNLFSVSADDASCFQQARQFGIRVGDRWIHFRLPD